MLQGFFCYPDWGEADMLMDEFHMNQALSLAEKGWGMTNPNPLVGAVIVRDGHVIGEGYHAKLGGAHAERDALNQARLNHQDVRGATIYVTLEPCTHHGRTPPCTDAIIESGIGEVVVAMQDPNPLVSGKGIQQLREAGIKVRTGVLEQEAKKLNEIFISYMTHKKPFVIMKVAMTLDGKIATATGDSRWISCAMSRQYVHHWRNRVASIMVGSQTIFHDDPLLTTRLSGTISQDPVRIVVDSVGRIPLESRVINNTSNVGMILASTSRIPPERERQFTEKGVQVLKLDGFDGKVDLKALMNRLAQMEIDSVLLEGGGNLNYAALRAGIVDKVLVFIAPKIIGGDAATTPVEGIGFARMEEAIKLNRMISTTCGEDILIEGYIT